MAAILTAAREINEKLLTICQLLVRDSGHEAGSYSLSVRVGAADNKVIFHYIIKRDHGEKKFILVPAPVSKQVMCLAYLSEFS